MNCLVTDPTAKSVLVVTGVLRLVLARPYPLLKMTLPFCITADGDADRALLCDGSGDERIEIGWAE